MKSVMHANNSFPCIKPWFGFQFAYIQRFFFFVLIKGYQFGVFYCYSFHRCSLALSLTRKPLTFIIFILIPFRQIAGYNVFEWVFNHFHSEDLWCRLANGMMWLLISITFAYFEYIEIGRTFDFSEYGMLLVQPWAGIYCDKELALVRVRFWCIGHSHDSPVRKLESLVKLIHESTWAWRLILRVNGLASLASSSRVSTLNHEILDNTVEHRHVIITF